MNRTFCISWMVFLFIRGFHRILWRLFFFYFQKRKLIFRNVFSPSFFLWSVTKGFLLSQQFSVKFRVMFPIFLSQPFKWVDLKRISSNLRPCIVTIKLFQSTAMWDMTQCYNGYLAFKILKWYSVYNWRVCYFNYYFK